MPYDLKLARVNDYTVISSAASYSRFVPDLTGNLQLGAGGQQLKNIAAASTSLGLPALAYVDFSVGGAAGAKLKYARRNGGRGNSPWEKVLVPGTVNPMFPSLAFDDDDNPWISYFDSATLRFFITMNSRSDGNGTWSTYEFPSIPAGAPSGLPAANNTALLMFKVGGISSPLVVIVDNNAGSKGVKAALFNSNTQTWSAVALIDNLASGALGAAHLNAAIDSSNNVGIIYQDLSATRARYSFSTNGTTWSTPISISGIGQGVGAKIAVNSKTGKPAASYYDQPYNTVYYAGCSTSIPNCVSAKWSPVQVDSATGVSGLTAATGQLLSTALMFSPSGTPWLFYPAGQSASGSLMRASNSGSTWNSAIQVSGTSGNLPGSSAMNFGVSGWNVVSSLNSVLGPVASFIGPGNSLYSVSCGD